MALHKMQNYVPKQLLLHLVIGLTIITMMLLSSSLASKATSSSNMSQIATPITKPGCLQSCGSVTIPYPFGTNLSCSYNETFLITCNQTKNSNNQKPFLSNTNVSITDISVADGELRVESHASRACYNKRGKYVKNDSNYDVSLISRTRVFLLARATSSPLSAATPSGLSEAIGEGINIAIVMIYN